MMKSIVTILIFTFLLMSQSVYAETVNSQAVSAQKIQSLRSQKKQLQNKIAKAKAEPQHNTEMLSAMVNQLNVITQSLMNAEKTYKSSFDSINRNTQ